MTWQEPGDTKPAVPDPAPGGDDPSLEETRTEWPTPEPAAPSAPEPAAPHAPPAAPASGPAGVPPPVPTSPPSAPPSSGGWSGQGGGYPAGGYPPGGAPPAMGWAPPPGQGAGAGPVAGFRFAGVGERVVAWLLDSIIIALVTLPISFILGAAIVGSVDWSTLIGTGSGYAQFLDEGWIARSAAVSLLGAAIGALINAAYFTFQWSSGARATIGMRILGLQVGNAADGRTIGRGQAFRRWLALGEWIGVLASVPVIGGLASLGQLAWYLVLLGTTASNPQRRGLHDQFGETAIVVDAGRSNSGAIVGCLVLALLLFVVLPFVAIVALIFLGGQVSEILSTVGESI